MVGPLPPPIGGISIHIRRLSGLLKSRGLECLVYDESRNFSRESDIIPIRSYKRFIFKIPFIQGDLFHFHTIDKRLRILLGYYKLLGKKIMLTIHGESLSQQLEHSSPLIRRLLLWSLKSIDGIVCVNEATTQMLLELGFHSDKVKTIPAYLHPVEREEDVQAIPQHVYKFMEDADFVISANGFIRLDHNKDLYGVDLLIELMRELKFRKLRVRLIFAALGTGGQSAEERGYYEELKQRVKKYQLTECFYWYEVEQTELYPILKKSNLFIRPTRMDGYGVSIAEALHFQVPSIASNVCRRPDGTILFSSGDIVELTTKVQEMFYDYEAHKEAAKLNMPVDYGNDLIEVYQLISSKKPMESKVIPNAHG